MLSHVTQKLANLEMEIAWSLLMTKCSLMTMISGLSVGQLPVWGRVSSHGICGVTSACYGLAYE